MPQAYSSKTHLLVGILRGEGSGPEVIDAACDVLSAVAERCRLTCRSETGGDVGYTAAERTGKFLSDDVADFCGSIFERGGAILAGAAGGRFVYDLRRRFELYYKLNPLRSYPELRHVCRIKLPTRPIDIVLVRENLQGIYQGDAVELNGDRGREVLHRFICSESHVRAVISKAIALASQRRNSIAVVGKAAGTPLIHSLWSECALKMAEHSGVNVCFVDIDYAAYKLLQEPEAFDVIVAPNCFGDILSDLGGVLAGSRGLTFGASYSAAGGAVYQTNHGAAHDRANTDTANPVAQIFSIAMMLRESFGLPAAADMVEEAVRTIWCAGWRTHDLAEPGCRIAGTREMGCLIADAVNAAGVCEACSATG